MNNPDPRSAQRLPAATGLLAAVLAASCCVLPIALIATGVAGAGLMMTMMRYEWLTLPLGVFGLAGAYGRSTSASGATATPAGAGSLGDGPPLSSSVWQLRSSGWRCC